MSAGWGPSAGGGGSGGGLTAAAIDAAPAAAQANLADHIPASQGGVLAYLTPQQIHDSLKLLAAAGPVAGADLFPVTQAGMSKAQTFTALQTAFGAGGALPLSGYGTVTSVALTAPAILSVAGSPVSGAGTFALSLATQNANLLFAGPGSGGAAAPGFRALVDADASGLWVALAPATSARNTVQGTADVVPFTVKRYQAGSASDLQDWTDQTGTVLSSVSSSGAFLALSGTVGAPGIAFAQAPTRGIYAANGATQFAVAGVSALAVTANGIVARAGNVIGISSGAPDTNAPDVAVSRVSSSLLALGNGNNGDTSGSLLARMRRITKTANYTVLASDTNTLIDNTGAVGEVDLSLPAAASGIIVGMDTRAAQIFKAIANGTDTIRLGASVSAAGGNISASAIGSWVYLVGFAGGWDGLYVGAWVVT